LRSLETAARSAGDLGEGAMTLNIVERGAFALALLLATPAMAQHSQNWTTCVNGTRAFSADAAIGACTELIHSNADKPSRLYAALTNRGISHYEKQDYDRAIADHTAAIHLNPRESTAFVNRGNAYRAKGDAARAVADFNEALRINPQSAAAFFNRSIVFSQRQEFDRAIADINDAIRLSPKNSDYVELRGMLFEAKGDINRARANFIVAQQLK
jgi:tetratricopeptide (TPR) repeat protein